LILNETQKNIAILKHTWNVGLEGLGDKKRRCTGLEAYYDEN
jgi:hypothetical protein